jgi:hypothetical protein
MRLCCMPSGSLQALSEIRHLNARSHTVTDDLDLIFVRCTMAAPAPSALANLAPGVQARVGRRREGLSACQGVVDSGRDHRP